MKKNLHTALILFSTLLIFACSTIALSESIQIKNASTKYKAGGGYYDFNPEIANAMKLNWFSSADNRAMLTLVLALQVADDRVMGSEDVASGFLVNTSYLGKTYKSNMNVYIALGRTDDYFIYIIYSPDAKQASFFLQDNTYGRKQVFYLTPFSTASWQAVRQSHSPSRRKYNAVPIRSLASAVFRSYKAIVPSMTSRISARRFMISSMVSPSFLPGVKPLTEYRIQLCQLCLPPIR